MLTRQVVLFVLCASVCPCLGSAATLFVPETFGDGGAPAANGWSVGNSGGLVADAGDQGVGDHALEYGTTSGFHLLHPIPGSTPNPVFQGDYLADGVTAVRFKARHTGIGDTAVLRSTAFLPLANGNDWATSSTSVTISPNATSWQTYELSLMPSDLFSGGTNSPTVTDVLSNVSQIGLRHDPAGTGPLSPSFVSTLTQVQFDDIMLVPEPGTFRLVLLMSLALMIGLRKRTA